MTRRDAVGVAILHDFPFRQRSREWRYSTFVRPNRPSRDWQGIRNARPSELLALRGLQPFSTERQGDSAQCPLRRVLRRRPPEWLLIVESIGSAHRFFSLNVNKSLTSTFSILANFSKPATDGELTPRSTRLMNSTEQQRASASCSWVSFLSFAESCDSLAEFSLKHGV